MMATFPNAAPAGHRSARIVAVWPQSLGSLRGEAGRTKSPSEVCISGGTSALLGKGAIENQPARQAPESQITTEVFDAAGQNWRPKLIN